MNGNLTHGLSIDVECYYQIVSNDYLGKIIEPTKEVLNNTLWLLDVLGELNLQATFFCLGNVARKFPELLVRMANEGHEIGVHGDMHAYIHRMSPSQFREELNVSVGSIEETTGTKVLGHRAPAFSVLESNLWALDVMLEKGLLYDSSIFPVKKKHYGISGSPRTIHKLKNGLYEVPMTVVDFGKRELAGGGGGHFRLFPYFYTNWVFRSCENEDRPVISYFHPYEFELSRPRLPPNAWLTPQAAARLLKFNIIQSIGRGKSMRKKWLRLLQDYKFCPIKNLLNHRTV